MGKPYDSKQLNFFCKDSEEVVSYSTVSIAVIMCCIRMPRDSEHYDLG